MDEAAKSVSIQVLDSLGEGRGGLTKAVFDRFRLLSETSIAILVTVAYQPNVRQVFDRLKKKGLIPQDSELRSFHEDSRKQRIVGHKVTPEWHQWSASKQIEAVPDGASIVRYYCSGKFLGLIARDGRGKLSYSDIHEPNRPWLLSYREKYWVDDSLAVREFIDESGSPRHRIYYNQDGVPYLTTWVTPGRYEYRTTYWPEVSPETLGDVRAANAVWLNRLVAEYGNVIVYFDEPRTSFAASAKQMGAKTVATIHTTHRKNSSVPEIKPWAKTYLANKTSIDLFVVLTDLQRQHLTDDLGLGRRQVVVIPHGVPVDVIRSVAGIYDSKRFVIISRLAKEKRVDEGIKAFERVVSKIPSASLEIYGTGTEYDSLSALVKLLDIESNVTFYGRTEKPLDEFMGACASIVTSNFEGFGLTILESMSQGTPVVGYRVLYGPASLINDSNGALVNDADSESLGSVLLRLAQDMEFRDRMSAGALTTAANHSSKEWELAWNSVSSALQNGDVGDVAVNCRMLSS